MALEFLGGALRLVGAEAEGAQHVRPHAQGRVQAVAVDVLNAGFEQIVGVGPVEGAGQDGELREVLAYGVDEFQRLLGAGIVSRQM